MSPTIDELFKPVSAADFRTRFNTYLAAKKVRTTAWWAGAPTNLFIAGVSNVLAGFSAFQCNLAKMGFSGYAKGSWLDVRGTYGQNLPRRKATSAKVVVVLHNTTGTSQTAALIVVENVVTGKQYSRANVTIAANAFVGFVFTALQPGSSSNAQPGQVTRIVTSGLSWLDPLISNVSPSTGGADDETASEYEARLDADLFTRSPLPVSEQYSAIVQGPLAVNGTTPIGVTRTSRVWHTAATRTNTLYVATSGGAPPPADLAILRDLVNLYLGMPGFVTDVQGATSIDLNFHVRIRAFRPPPLDFVTRANAAIVGVLATVPIGGYDVGASAGVVPPSIVDQAIIDEFAEYQIVDVVAACSAQTADVMVQRYEIPAHLYDGVLYPHVWEIIK